jgi:glycine cleavage system aminomethyltransferase T
MLETRGKLSKRLVLLAVDGADAIAADTTIADDAGKDIGRVTSSVQGDDGTLALGYVKAAFAEKGRVLSVGGRSAEVRDLAG